MSKFVLILVFISFWSVNIYGQHNRSMESNRFSYVSSGQGIQYTAVKIGYDIRSNLYIELQSLTDGGGIWKESNTYNDWRVLSFLGAIDVALLRTELRAGMGIMHTNESSSNFFKSMGIAPQISGVIRVYKKVGIGVSVVWPISSAQNLILPTTTFCIEYRIGRYVKENGLH
mgnify:CR=1 FL=1|jgi:hypothetical protein